MILDWSNGGEDLVRVLIDIALGRNKVMIDGVEVSPTIKERTTAAVELLDRAFGTPVTEATLQLQAGEGTEVTLAVSDARKRLLDKLDSALAVEEAPTATLERS